MYARYWAARKKYAQAVAQVEQLLAANPDSPYIDQALKFSADCDVKRGQTAGALATLNRLVKNYPGSPLVPDVKKANRPPAKRRTGAEEAGDGGRRWKKNGVGEVHG